MTPSQIFAVQFTMSFTIYALIARWYVAPVLRSMPLHDALIPLVFLQAFRHMGLVFLLPGFVGSELPPEFAIPTAYGDLATGVLALVSVVALRGRWAVALALVWITNTLGMLDFLYGNYQGARLGVRLGAAYYIPTIANPAMWVSHFMVLGMLLGRARAAHLEPDRGGATAALRG
jgi:hypothetical protein